MCTQFSKMHTRAQMAAQARSRIGSLLSPERRLHWVEKLVSIREKRYLTTVAVERIRQKAAESGEVIGVSTLWRWLAAYDAGTLLDIRSQRGNPHSLQCVSDARLRWALDELKSRQGGPAGAPRGLGDLLNRAFQQSLKDSKRGWENAWIGRSQNSDAKSENHARLQAVFQ